MRVSCLTKGNRRWPMWAAAAAAAPLCCELGAPRGSGPCKQASAPARQVEQIHRPPDLVHVSGGVVDCRHRRSRRKKERKKEKERERDGDPRPVHFFPFSPIKVLHVIRPFPPANGTARKLVVLVAATRTRPRGGVTLTNRRPPRLLRTAEAIYEPRASMDARDAAVW